MKPKKFKEIKKKYDNFYKDLLRSGKLPLWSTELGFWNAAISNEVYEAFKRLNLQNSSRFLDLGSGDGKVALLASLFCKEAHGVEIDKKLFEKSIEMKSLLDLRNTSFYNKDFLDHSLNGYDVVFINPDKPIKRELEAKLLDELNGTLIVHGHHFHPTKLKKKESFLVDNTLVTSYSKE